MGMGLEAGNRKRQTSKHSRGRLRHGVRKNGNDGCGLRR
jgi:hypothetical protein